MDNEPAPVTESAASAAGPPPKLFGHPMRPSNWTPVAFELLGPELRTQSGASTRLWSAHVHLVEWVTDTAQIETRWRSRAARSLFAQSKAKNDLTHFPGTILICCRVYTVKMNLTGIEYTFGKEVPNQPTDEVELLIHANQSEWDEFGLRRVQLRSALCVGGEFAVPDSLTLESAVGEWRKHFTECLTIDNAPKLTCSASGLILEGKAKLNWPSPPIPKTRYFVQGTLPFPDTGLSQLIVFPDRESLRTPEFREAREALSTAFGSLEAALNPVSEPPLARRGLSWSSLELTDPAKLPHFAWHMEPETPTKNPKVSFRFDRGQWRLQLADQPSGIDTISPRGVLSTMPEVAIEKATADGKLNVILSTLRQSTIAAPPTAVYAANDEDANGEFQESWHFSQLDLEYRELEVAQTLRELHGIPTPRPNRRTLPPPDAPTSSDLLAGASEPGPEVSPQALWGFMPLEDGWAQLPFLNTTEQICLDALPQKIDDPTQPTESPTLATDTASRTPDEPLFRGAVSIGNDRPDVWRLTTGEVPWNVTLLDAASLQGTWTLKVAGPKLTLSKIKLILTEPELLAEGLFWLAKHTPTAADALPDNSNWVDAHFSPSLGTVRNGDLYPSLFMLRFDSLALQAEPPAKTETILRPVKAVLTSSAMTFQKNDRVWPFVRPDMPKRTIYDHLLNDKKNSPFDGDDFWAVSGKLAHNTGLVWRRHPQAPLIQTLPFTQSAVPPNHPNASRQYAPFQLPVIVDEQKEKPAEPDNWRFKGLGANQWLELDAPIPPASFWQPGLPLTSLGLAGLTVDPHAAAGLMSLLGSNLPDSLHPQFHHELPYLDEIHALAQLPRDDEPKLSPATRVEELITPPPALLRENFAAHFQKLADLAFHAGTSADAAMFKDGSGQVTLQGTVEPLHWPMSPPTVDLRQYPGSLSFDPKLTLSDEPDVHGNSPAPGTLDGLAGIEGRFRRETDDTLKLVTDPAHANYHVVGGSLQAAIETVDKQARIRDQRGLRRSSTTKHAKNERLLETTVDFEETPGTRTTFTLTTLLQTVQLSLAGDQAFEFWFRDLPVRPKDRTFHRADPCNSSEHRGASLPEGLSRKFSHLTGYEWRLGHSSADAAGPAHGTNGKSSGTLRIGPFVFFPLSLDTVVFDTDGLLTDIAIIGRLQLPLAETGKKELEQVTRHNAVRLVFKKQGKLGLQTIEILGEEPDGPLPSNPTLPQELEWPLAVESDSQGTPLMRVSNLDFDPATKKTRLEFRLSYTSHGVLWTLPKATVQLPFDNTPIPLVEYRSKLPAAGQIKLDYDDSKPVHVKAIDFRIAPFEPVPIYSLKTTWAFLWDDTARMQLSAKITEGVFGPTPNVDVEANLTHSSHKGLSLNLRLDETNPSRRLDHGAVQVIWDGLSDQITKRYWVDPSNPKQEDTSLAADRLEIESSRFTWKNSISRQPSDHEKEELKKLRDKTSYPISVRLAFSDLLTELDKPSEELQLLPGFRLTKNIDRATSGFGVISFNVTEKPGTVPSLGLQGGAFEALFACQWGTLWQDVPQTVANKQPAELDDALFQSSSGQIDAEYVCRFVDSKPEGVWKSELMLSGLLEVTNLISWPTALLNRLANDPDNVVTLPATRPKAGAERIPFTHLRHIARVLLNQHRIPAKSGTQDVLVGSSNPNIVLDLWVENDVNKPKRGSAWTWQATVEHQLLEVPFDADGKPVAAQLGRDDIRWTTAQEVRLCSPTGFQALLKGLQKKQGIQPAYPLAGDDGLGESDKWLRNEYRKANAGLVAQTLLEELVGNNPVATSAISRLQGKALFVEASVTAFIRREPPPDSKGQSLSGLTYLPSGSPHAVVSALTDFDSPRLNQTDDPTSWVMLQLPFFGRLIHTTDPDIAKQPLVDDPVQSLRSARQSNQPPAKLALWLANWEDTDPKRLPLAEFDLVWRRLFRRLDPASLRESWFRLNLAAAAPEFLPEATADSDAEQLLSGVLSSALTDGPGVLGRPEVLRNALDPRRPHLPPSEDARFPNDPSLPDPEAPHHIEIVWYPLNLWVLQTDSQPQGFNNIPEQPELPPPPASSRSYLFRYGFLGAGAILLQAMKSGVLVRRDQNGNDAEDRQPTLHAAATLMPPQRDIVLDPTGTKKVLNRHPLSLTLSPYLRLRLVTAGQSDGQLLATVGELIAFSTRRDDVRVISSQLWSGKQAETADISTWAKESHKRLAADSPVAIVRVRELRTVETTVRVRYEFTSASATPLIEALIDRAASIQAAPQLQRRREGMYGGQRMPESARVAVDLAATLDLRPWEFAPPLVDGVQPIRRHKRPGDGADATNWPWGLSTLRLSITQREASTGTVSKLTKTDDTFQGPVWWQGLFQPVQYQTPGEVSSDRTLLPTNFRADARPGDHAAWPNMPLPSPKNVAASLQTEQQPLTDWQSVLVGRLHCLLTGSRPGAPFLLRPNLQTQDLAQNVPDDSSYPMQSGGVPVQHRAPRPVVIPRNRQKFANLALQTWSSPFDLINDDGTCPTLRVSELPFDQAMVLEQGTVTGIGLELTARALTLGPATGTVILVCDTESPNQKLPKGSRLNMKPDVPGLHFVTRRELILSAPSSHTIEIEVEAVTEPDEELQGQVASNSEYELVGDFSGLKNVSIKNVKPTGWSFDCPAIIPIDQLLRDSSSDLDLIAKRLLRFSLLGQVRPQQKDDPPFGEPGHGKLVEDWVKANSVFLTNGDETFAFTSPLRDGSGVLQSWFDVGTGTEEMKKKRLDQFHSWLGSRRHGELLWLRVTVGNDHATEVKGYCETLTFGFRISRRTRQPAVPLSPRHILFEDPEYNRRLSSNTANRSAVRKLSNGQSTRLTLATDRREYNASGAIHYLFYCDPPTEMMNPPVHDFDAMWVTFARIHPTTGVPTALKSVKLKVNQLPDQSADMRLELLRGKAVLAPGDILRLQLALPKAVGQGEPEQPAEEKLIELDVSIVRDPVIPMPEAAYALLRHQPGTDESVECVRFAWGPEPRRVELLNANDLRRETVRRRAVFCWSDVFRSSSRELPLHAIQKISANGSTHMPDFPAE